MSSRQPGILISPRDISFRHLSVSLSRSRSISLSPSLYSSLCSSFPPSLSLSRVTRDCSFPACDSYIALGFHKNYCRQTVGRADSLLKTSRPLCSRALKLPLFAWKIRKSSREKDRRYRKPTFNLLFQLFLTLISLLCRQFRAIMHSAHHSHLFFPYFYIFRENDDVRRIKFIPIGCKLYCYAFNCPYASSLERARTRFPQPRILFAVLRLQI